MHTRDTAASVVSDCRNTERNVSKTDQRCWRPSKCIISERPDIFIKCSVQHTPIVVSVVIVRKTNSGGQSLEKQTDGKMTLL